MPRQAPPERVVRTAPSLRTVLAYVAAFLPLFPLLNLTNGYHLDWANHTWMISYMGEYFVRHWSFPAAFNTDRLIGMAYPVFYGYLFFPAAGLISAITGGNIAIRLVCILVSVLQVVQIRKTFEAVTHDRFLAFSVAILAAWGTYPLTNLYSRSAVPEFVAASLVVSACMMCLRLPLLTNARDRRRLMFRVGLVMAFCIGTHPITAVLGSVAVAAVLAASILRLPDKPAFFRQAALAGGLVVCAAAPWGYAVLKYGNKIALVENGKGVSVFSYNVDRVACRFSPVPWDPRMSMSPENWNSPHLDMQANDPLLLFALWLIGVASWRGLRRGFYFYAGMTACAAAFVAAYASVSESFWHIFSALKFVQFSYRMITYIDTAALIAVFFLAGTLVSLGELRRRAVRIALCSCVAIASAGLVVKLAHTRDIAQKHIVLGAGLSRADRNALTREPENFYGENAYAFRGGLAGELAPKAAVYLPVAGGVAFGQPLSVQTKFAQPTPVQMNLQPSPWNHPTVDGREIPREKLHYDAGLRTVLMLSGQRIIVGYYMTPDRTWLSLRLISMVAVGGWTTALLIATLLGTKVRWRRAAAGCVVAVAAALLSGGLYAAVSTEPALNPKVSGLAGIIHAKPMDPELLKAAALRTPIYIEDKRQIGESLVAHTGTPEIAYLDDDHRNIVTLSMNTVPPADRESWLRHYEAMYLQYDGSSWRDATSSFRAFLNQHPNDTSLPPEITITDPPRTRAGLSFNTQADGRSAISVVGRWFEPGAVVLFNGQPLKTMFASSERLTATVPQALYSKPGKLPVQVKNPDGSTSAARDFLIQE